MARASLATVIIKDTVNAALRAIAADAKREQRIATSVRALVTMRVTDADRQEAWR